jgi:glycosyltransferase involved in cell wall biosynthesis
MREYMRWPYSRCQRVLAPSEATRRLLVSSRTNENRTGIWTRGVDADQFSPARRSQALRACWGAPDDVPVLLYVGRVSREKGLDALPPLLDRLRARGVAHRLVVVGDGPLLPELRERCPSAIFTGPVEHDSVPVAFASSDVFLFPSRTDTAGNVVLEAQASGLPVVVAHDGGPRENIRPDRSGFVVRDMGRELADVVALLLRDRSLRTRMAAEARRYALGRSWQVALEPLFDAYRDAALTGAHAGATRREDRHGSNLRAAER